MLLNSCSIWTWLSLSVYWENGQAIKKAFALKKKMPCGLMLPFPLLIINLPVVCMTNLRVARYWINVRPEIKFMTGNYELSRAWNFLGKMPCNLLCPPGSISSSTIFSCMDLNSFTLWWIMNNVHLLIIDLKFNKKTITCYIC